jgi:hypothetical protein
VPNGNYKGTYNKIVELYGMLNTLVDLAYSPSNTYKD